MTTGTDVLDTRNDPYASYGAKVGTTGQFLSFKSGEFLFGHDATELPIGTRLVANMPALRVGWRRWFGAEVTEDLTEPLVSAGPMQRRDTLGDLDESKWETDDRGDPRDPWQLTNILELSDGEETYIYSTGSKGGIGAIGRLCKEYGKEYRLRPGMLPIIELGRDFYNHKKFGKTYFPEFKIVGWADENNPSLEGEGEEKIPFEPATESVASTKAAPAATNGGRRATRF